MNFRSQEFGASGHRKSRLARAVGAAFLIALLSPLAHADIYGSIVGVVGGRDLRGGIRDGNLTLLRDDLARRAAAIASELAIRGERMDPRDRNEIDLNLSQIEQILRQGLGGGTRPYPIPVPGPYPGPRPAPYPGPIPYPGVRVTCANQDFGTYQRAFEQIKSFAYASVPNGLNRTSTGATQFAQEFTQSHGCEQVDRYISEMQRLMTFGHASRGVNLTSSGAADYALQKIDSICQLGVDYTTEGARFYDFAYSASGLNMTSSSASRYAQQKVEEQFLSCPGRIQF